MISKNINEAAKCIEAGKVVGIPTETVYGLAASIRMTNAVKQIFQIKERPFFDPLIVHIYDYSQVPEVISDWLPLAQFLAEKFWPGPLTLVLPKATELDPLITSGLDTVGMRMPSHPIARDLLRKVGVPLAAPSANKFGKTSPTTAEHVSAEFGDDLFILDGGPSEVGVESTVLRICSNRIEILRPGVITYEMICDAISRSAYREIGITKVASSASPGHLESHYQPKLPLRILDKSEVPETGGIELELSSDPSLAARTLYSELRRLSDSNAKFIFVRKKELQLDGVWDAIWDRINRAAAKV